MKLTKEKALKKIEELKSYVAQEEAKEVKGYIIKSRYDDSVIYTSSKDNVKDAVIEAIGEGVSLSGADLSGAEFYNEDKTIKLKKNQITDFLNALGFKVEE